MTLIVVIKRIRSQKALAVVLPKQSVSLVLVWPMDLFDLMIYVRHLSLYFLHSHFAVCFFKTTYVKAMVMEELTWVSKQRPQFCGFC